MNNLNSILIEGIVTEEAKFIEHKDFCLCQFAITSKRYFNDSKAYKPTCVAIEAHRKLAIACKDKAIVNTSIRVVGRLENDSSGKVYVLAEHIEFR